MHSELLSNPKTKKTQSLLLIQSYTLIEKLIEAEKFVEQIKIGNKSKMYDSDLLPIIELEIEELTSAIFSICNMLEEKYNWCA